MKNFSEFVKEHKAELYSFADKNTLRDSQGRAVITKTDPWFYEDEWDAYYEELTANEGDLSARGMVR